MKKVLVIDNTNRVLWLIDKIFSEKYEVIRMNNGLDAWSFLSEGNHCDLIVSDMKRGTPYIDLLENIRNTPLLKDIPFIMLSGFENADQNIYA